MKMYDSKIEIYKERVLSFKIKFSKIFIHNISKIFSMYV